MVFLRSSAKFAHRLIDICGDENREKESDILELADQFGGLILDRPERKGYSIDEAINLIEHRNLRGKNNIYLDKFKEFMYLKEGVAA